MFFRRAKVHIPAFNERMESVQKLGIASQTEGSGRVRLTRDGIGAIVTDVANSRPHVDRAGLMIGSEIGALVNGGYQQYWLTPSKQQVPALAWQLKALHEFEEDLKEGLGLTSLYNTSLGTISALHLYDRVEERDETVHPGRPWDGKSASL
ncbi:MAG: hypothetical protein ACR2NN_29245 [Bryobacteraceae bacterium]